MLQERVVPFRDAKGAIVRMISTARDLTRELSLEDRIDYLNRFDQLTGLPNRGSLIELLEQTVAAAKASGAFVSVLIIDIDLFKHVNDLCGAGAGDEVLRQIAARIRSSVSPADIVARTGNDEFAVVHVDGDKPVLAGAVAQRLRTALSQPIAVNGQDIALTVSAGIAVHPDDGDDAWSLLKDADLALARAKAQGRNAIQFFDREITGRVKEFFILERRLFTALANNEYLLYYQPYCDLRSRKVSGAEALIRWKNPDLGVVSPAKFIPSLEDTGKVIEVGRWILETACVQSKEWERKNRHVPVSVNLSLAQFRHEHLVGMVKDAINDSRIDARRLTLEVTETVFMHDMEFAIRTMKQLKDLGVALSVDDFGTGYSSLSYIKKLPVDNLKIDMCFVRDVTTDQDAASIIAAITTLAQNLKLKTIAEGVETEEQRNILHLLRCDMGQGYLFSPAVDAREFEKILE
jgi:diguanylate cyclase (GGDEF)-like protein